MIYTRLLLCSAAATQALQLARPVPQPKISERTTYNGGWALGLSGSSCPSDAPVACDTGAGSINPMCCPSGQTCSGSIRPYCCPTSADCVNVVQNVPVCANSSWNMYTQGGGNYFCCGPNQYGVLPLHGYAGICEPLDQAVASSLVATPASQIGGAAVTVQGSQTGGGGGETSTATITSTLSGGALTTITTAISGAATGTATKTSSSSSSESTGLNSNGGATATITMSKGAEIGIAVAVGIIALIAAFFLFRCLRRRSQKSKLPKTAQEGYSFQNQAQGPAPVYSAQPQNQNQQMGQGQAPYVVSPIQEYKTPVVGVQPYGSPSPQYATPPSSAGGFSPPPQHQYANQQQHQFGGHGNLTASPVQGRYEVPGAPVVEPVEAPNSWVRGL